MSFAINPSLTHIDFLESQILEIYRSKGQIQLSDARFRGHPCEAVICIARIDKTVTARIALLETVMNSIFVYTSDFSAEQSSDYPKVLKEAMDFTASFGFTMEKVNLEFSPAMREVIIKGIRVMRPPVKKQKLRSLNTTVHLEQQPLEPPLPSAAPATESKAESATANPEEIRRLATSLASANALIEKISREKQQVEENAAREITSLKASEKTAHSERIAVSKKTQELEVKCAEKLDKAVRQHTEQITQLQSALDSAESTGKTLRDEISRLNATLKISEKEIRHWEKELSKEKSASAEKIAQLTSDLSSLNNLLEAEKNSAANKISELAHFETSLKESQQREEDLCRSLDVMKEQLDQRDAELEKLRRQEEREATLLQTIAALEKEVAEARSAGEQRSGKSADLTSLETELKCLSEARNDVEAEYIRMANEAMQKETEMLEALYHADAEIVRLSRELDICQQKAEMEKTSLLNELQRLKDSRAALPAMDTPLPSSDGSASPPAAVATPVASASDVQSGLPEDIPLSEASLLESPVQSGEMTDAPPPVLVAGAETDLAEDSTLDDLIIDEDEITKGLLNEFGSFYGSSGPSATEFTINPDIRSIDYSDPAEILAILFSNNSVQAVPDGGSVQRCKGYVIALKKAGQYRVYLAWFMPENNKVVICTPEQQPADVAECTQMVQDAVSYFEIVGFMMEVQELGNTVRSYLHAINNVPALNRV